jgi:hypothetical protein
MTKTRQDRKTDKGLVETIVLNILKLPNLSPACWVASSFFLASQNAIGFFNEVDTFKVSSLGQYGFIFGHKAQFTSLN